MNLPRNILTLSWLLFVQRLAAHDQVDIGRQRAQYWQEKGLENPARHLRELADWSLLYFNTSNGMRPVLLFTIATPASVAEILPRSLQNLASFVSQEQVDTYGRTTTTLAQHTIVGSTNEATQKQCDELAKKYEQKCYELDHGFNRDVVDLHEIGKTKAHAYSLGLSRIKSLLDLISLGYDVLYFDLKHFFFQNPLRYMYQHTSAHIVVSPTNSHNCGTASIGPDGSLPDDHHRLDMAFIRTSTGTFRCIYNWLFWSGHSSHDINDRPLDYHTFRDVMQECISTLGTSILSVEYLSPVYFPSDCATVCGCANSAAVAPLADGTCSKDAMSSWVAFAFPCTRNVPELVQRWETYNNMFTKAGLAVTH